MSKIQYLYKEKVFERNLTLVLYVTRSGGGGEGRGREGGGGRDEWGAPHLHPDSELGMPKLTNSRSFFILKIKIFSKTLQACCVVHVCHEIYLE